MSDPRNQREEFLAWLLEQLGKPYIWGGKDGNPGFDCSGLITCGYFMRGLPDWRQTHTAHDLFEALPPIQRPSIGDVCGYGSPDKITHVMILWNGGRVLGASGGDSSTLTIHDATHRNAKVKIKPVVTYRPDFRAYRASPFPPMPQEDDDIT